jgi:hypothetical protein
MATTKITDLTAYTDPVNTDVLPIVDVTSDVTKKVSIANVMKNASLGSNTAPGIAFDGDPNTGIYSPGADQVAVTTGGTQRLLIDSAGAVTIAGDLTVNGTTTNINTTNLVIEDKNIILGDVTTPTDVTADGGGITLKGTTDKTINWVDSTDAWTSSERFSYPLGSAAAPTLTFTGDANTGIYSPGADQVAISTSGTGRLFVDANGNVGVGAASPVNNAGYGGLTINGADGAILSMMQGGAETFRVTNATGYSFINTTGATPLLFGTGANERMRLTSAGLLGLGTSSPSSLLSLSGSSAYVVQNSGRALAGIDLQATAGGSGLFGGAVSFGVGGTGRAAIAAIQGTTDNDVVGLGFFGHQSGTAAADAVEYMRIDGSTGRVGIGTTSPGHALHVSNGNDSASGEFVGITIGGTNSANARTGSIIKDTTTYDLIYKNQNFSSALGAHVFRNGPSEHARIDSSGRLLVGTSTARSNFLNGSTSGLFQVEAANSEVGRYTAQIYGLSANAAGPYHIFAKHRSSSVGGVTVVAESDQLGALSFQGSDGTEFVEGARIQGFVDGTPGADDMPGRLSFFVTADGAASPTEALRITNDQIVCYAQPAPTTKSGAATLTVAELKTKIIQYTGSANTLTLPNGTLMQGGFIGFTTNLTFEWSIINTGSDTCTIGTDTGHTIVGSSTVANGSSGRFASRRTASNTFVSYRLS